MCHIMFHGSGADVVTDPTTGIKEVKGGDAAEKTKYSSYPTHNIKTQNKIGRGNPPYLLADALRIGPCTSGRDGPCQTGPDPVVHKNKRATGISLIYKKEYRCYTEIST